MEVFAEVQGIGIIGKNPLLHIRSLYRQFFLLEWWLASEFTVNGT